MKDRNRLAERPCSHQRRPPRSEATRAPHKRDFLNPRRPGSLCLPSIPTFPCRTGRGRHAAHAIASAALGQALRGPIPHPGDGAFHVSDAAATRPSPPPFLCGHPATPRVVSTRGQRSPASPTRREPIGHFHLHIYGGNRGTWRTRAARPWSLSIAGLSGASHPTNRAGHRRLRAEPRRDWARR